MGQSSSKVAGRDATNGIVITLDALGTLFKFKEPVARQYIKVAQQCGLRDRIEEGDLKSAFRSSYKAHVLNYPNYGHGKLTSPTEWWCSLVDDTFGKVVNPTEIPKDLGIKLYDHFSSEKAYTLFPDVKPFLETVKTIRKQYSGAKSSSLIVGVITNSDPRVKNVLQGFGLRIGDARLRPFSQPLSGQSPGESPWRNLWNPEQDIDFLVTSYECGAEKPSSKIFFEATKQSGLVETSKCEQNLDAPLRITSLRNAFKAASLANVSIHKIETMVWIHVGDEVIKDFEGAKKFGLEGLLVDRDNKHDEHEGRVESLQDVATVVKLMAQEGFKAG